MRCAGPADVAAAIAFARRARLPLAVRAGGHCFAGRSSTEGVVVDVSPMRSVELSGTRAAIGAGAPLGEVYDALAAHGRAIPAGCGPTVGVAGLALGGGLGILGRAHGLTSDALRGAEVVLAGGEVVTCDADAHADLFWALRGAGGGRFGAVCTLVFETLPAPPATAFRLAWAPDAAAALVGAWQAWAPDAPDALAASLLVTAADGTARVESIGALAGSEAEAVRLLEELAAAAGAAPASATFAAGSLLDAKRFLSGDGGGDPAHPHHRSEFFARPLPAATVEALLHGLLDSPAPGCARELDFSPWGGAYARVPAGATAFAHRDARFLLKQSVAADGPPPDRELAWLDASWALAHPYGTGGIYPNFPEAGRGDWDPAYHGPNRERLLEVKRRYDPAGVFGGVAP